MTNSPTGQRWRDLLLDLGHLLLGHAGIGLVVQGDRNLLARQVAHRAQESRPPPRNLLGAPAPSTMRGQWVPPSIESWPT